MGNTRWKFMLVLLVSLSTLLLYMAYKSRPMIRDRTPICVIQNSTCLENLVESKTTRSLEILVESKTTRQLQLNYVNLILNNCRTLTSDPELTGPCAPMPTSLSENQKVIDSYPTNHDVTTFLSNMGFNKHTERDFEHLIPTFVTGCSANHFAEVQGVFRDFHEKVLPVYKDAKLIFYDLGLDPGQLNVMKAKCRCEVRKFNKTMYPAHVTDLTTFAWKPIIIQEVAMETGAVFWMDTSVRFTDGNLDDVFDIARKYGIAIWDTGHVLTSLTDPRMFFHLNETRCLYATVYVVEPGATIIYLTQLSQNYLMKPWVSCALTKDCIAPTGSTQGNCRNFNNGELRILFRCCHRQDQSMITILVNRIHQYHNNRNAIRPRQAIEFRRGDHVPYF